jgi:epoxyqueuosine reductase
LPAGSPFAPRATLAGKDGRQLARELLGMSQDEFGAAFKGSPMKRAKLRGPKRNAAVVLGHVGTARDVPVLRQALDDEERLVREHAAWGLRRPDRDRNAPRPRSDEGDSEPRQASAVRR